VHSGDVDIEIGSGEEGPGKVAMESTRSRFFVQYQVTEALNERVEERMNR
jgi:hypothetical protein